MSNQLLSTGGGIKKYEKVKNSNFAAKKPSSAGT
jgi:hypothetical protein|tara:strand:- start:999 stop:1100 length:102 start_codon:yes stop_codon:yes gene_type:complete